MLFYFTATGNSLYTAKKFSDNPISIPQIINDDKLVFEDEAIGIVCPVYCHQPPKIVVDFMKKATFKCDYFYMIMTYGKRKCNTTQLTDAIGKECGIKIDYIKPILMVDNYLPVFDMNEEMALDKKVDEQIAEALEDVKNRKCEIPPVTEEDIAIHAQLDKMNEEQPKFNSGEQITITDKCIGCGVCTKVCPIGNFTIKDGKATRKSEKCEFCLACAQLCPMKAIGLSIADKNPEARYLHPNITLTEIIEANNQN
jgi:ferredoxin